MTGIADAVVVVVGLLGVRDARAVVADVAHPVDVEIVLVGIDHEGTIVFRVRDPIVVEVGSQIVPRSFSRGRIAYIGGRFLVSSNLFPIRGRERPGGTGSCEDDWGQPTCEASERDRHWTSRIVVGSKGDTVPVRRRPGSLTACNSVDYLLFLQGGPDAACAGAR
jgi:hypothetical protein